MNREQQAAKNDAAGLRPAARDGEARAGYGVAESSFSTLQRALGNQAMLRLLESGGLQAKLRVSQPGDADEQEADRAAEQIASSQTVPRLQRKCACGGSCSQCQEEQEQVIHRSAIGPLRAFPFSIQRQAATTTPGEDASQRAGTAEAGARHEQTRHPGERPRTLIVEDDAPTLGPGQMYKTAFVTLLQTTTCATADAVLESVKHTTKGCPYIKKWLGHYKDKDAAQLMRAMHKYAPETARARSAHEAIALVNQRVERAALSWARTGKTTDLPEGIQEEMAGGGGGFLGAVMGFAHSGFGSALLGFIGGGKKESETSADARVQKKSRNGASAGEHDAAAVKEQLGSGQSLDGGVASRMSSAFGYDFSGVRVHTDAKAGDLSSQLNARAFTIGSDVAFAGGEYKPGTPVGDALIAHELAHVVQQGGGNRSGGLQTKDAALGDESSLEQEADRSAVGAVVSAWTGVKKGLAEVSANAFPRLKSGLKLQKCHHKAKQTLPGSPEQKKLPKKLPESPQQKKLPESVQIPEDELQKYLETLDETRAIEVSDTSANKAREVVRHWHQGDALYILTVTRKVLLIQQILQSGDAGSALQQGIIDLLSGTGNIEFEQVLKGVGEQELLSNLSEENRKKAEVLIANRRKQRPHGDKPTREEAQRTFPTEPVLQAQRDFTANAESQGRQDCIHIVRSMVPQLLARDKKLAEKVRKSLRHLPDLTIANVGNALVGLGTATGPTDIKFDNGNGNYEPTAALKSPWDTIMSQVGSVEGWHVFAMGPLDGYHSVTVLVEKRPDGVFLYWADQWALETEQERAGGFGQEAGSVSGFRRYEKAGFDQFVVDYTRSRWNKVHSEDSKCAGIAKKKHKNWDTSCRYDATLKIWYLK